MKLEGGGGIVVKKDMDNPPVIGPDGVMMCGDFPLFDEGVVALNITVETKRNLEDNASRYGGFRMGWDGQALAGGKIVDCRL